MNHRPEISIGAYSYEPGGPPLLYASCYAALVRDLFGDLDQLSDESRVKWIKYIQEFQTEDGLFRDPLIECAQAEEMDWWGWRHLTLHVLMTLTALGGRAQRTLKLIEPFNKLGYVSKWLEPLAAGRRTLLQLAMKSRITERLCNMLVIFKVKNGASLR